MRRNLLKLVRTKFMQDAVVLQVAALFNQASQMVSTIVVASLLGSRGQGVFFLAVGLQAMIYNLTNVGIVQATVTQIAAANVRDGHEKVRDWLAFLTKSSLAISVVLIGAGWLILPACAHWWYDRRLGVEDARLLGLWSWWLTLWPLLDTPRAVVQVAFQGTRRMRALGRLDNGTELMRMVLVIALTAATGSARGAVLGEILSRLTGSWLALEVYRRERREEGVRLPSMGEVLARMPALPMWQGMRLGLRVGYMKNATTLCVDIAPGLILGNRVGVSATAYFKIAQRVMGLPLMMLQGVARTVLPALSEIRGLRDLDRFRKLYYRVSLTCGALITAVLLVMLPLIRPVVGAFWPHDYADPVFTYSWILAIGLIPLSFSVGLDAFFMLTDQMKVSLYLAFVGTVVTVSLNVVLILALPVTGTAWGLSLYRGWTIFYFIYVSWYFRRRAHSGHWDR